MESKFFNKPVVYVGEVSINVTDLEHSLSFYQDMFGFIVLKKTDQEVVLSADGKRALLRLVQPEHVSPKEKGTTGLFHFAILLPTRADLANFLNHLVHVGGSEFRLGASDHGVSEALYFSDPDGNGIEVAHDRPSSEWNWSNGEVEMYTAALDGDNLLAERDRQWDGLPKDTVMGHIHLHVSELDKVEAFYTKGLGFNVVTRYPGAIFTSTGDYHHHIALNVWNGEGAKIPAKNSVGLNWYSIIFPDETTREKAVDQLQQIGANVVKEEDYYTTEDPSGNMIRLKLETS